MCLKYLKPDYWTRDYTSISLNDCPKQVETKRVGATSDLRLLVMLHGHGDDVEPDDNGDKQVKVMAGAHLVDEQAGGGVIRVVGLTLSFCWKGEVVGVGHGEWSKGRRRKGRGGS